MAIYSGHHQMGFQTIKMEFSYGDRVHILRGIKETKLQLMSHEGLPKALQNAGHLFMLQSLPQETKSSQDSVHTTLPAVAEDMATLLG